MRRRLLLRTRTNGEPLLPLMDVTFSLMFAFAMFVKSDFEVPPVDSEYESAAASQKAEARPIVRIDAQGTVTLNEQPSSEETLVESVQRLIATMPAGQNAASSPQTVRLEGHRQVEYGRLFAIREQLRRAGISVIEIGQVQP